MVYHLQIVKGGQLEECIANLQRFSEDAYLNALSAQVKVMLQGHSGSLGGLEPPQTNLLPPQNVARLLSILKEILSVASMVESRQIDITKVCRVCEILSKADVLRLFFFFIIIQIVSCVIDPLLQSVTESALHLPTVDMAVYLLNCLYQMQSTLAMFEYVDDRIERLQAQSDAQIDTLTSEQASSLVANLNLGPIYTLLQSPSSNIDTGNLNSFIVSQMNIHNLSIPNLNK